MSGRGFPSANGRGLQVSGRALARDVIPDSAVLHYPFSERSDSTLVEEEGGADGTANGITNVSGDWWDGYAEEGDGTDDYGELTNWSEVNFGANMDTDFAIICTIEGANLGSNEHWGVRGTGGEMTLRFGTMDFSDFSANGEAAVVVSDADGNEGAIEANTQIDDGSKYRIVFNKISNGVSDWEIWVNGSDDTNGTPRTDWSGSNLRNFDGDVYTHAYNHVQNDEDDNNMDAIIDNIIVCDDSLSSTEIQDDYDEQPWS